MSDSQEKPGKGNLGHLGALVFLIVDTLHIGILGRNSKYLYTFK